jgi:Zn-dependent membrane protease YugP
MNIIIIAIFFMIVSFAVGSTLKGKFRRYSKIGLKNNLTGGQIAELMLADHGIRDVKITSVKGHLTDHYNPMNKTVNLSEQVYYGRNAAAAAVASHECGHAVQHAMGYAPLKLRSALVPVQNASGRILNFVVLASIFGFGFLYSTFPTDLVLLIIIGCYAVLTLFSFVTLPVEFNASSRALAWVEERNIVDTSEYKMAKDALKWAAMTYVVAAIASLVSLLYYIMIFLGGSRD